MRRNCNLELRLVTPSFDDRIDIAENYNCQRQINMEEVRKRKEQDNEQSNQKLTIFYNGKVSSCDVTEIQAKSIISLASEEVGGEKALLMSPPPACLETSTISSSEYSSSTKPQLHYYKKQNNATGGGLSMKRSLQQFLQKRRTRIQATSPYYNNSTTR